MKSSDEAVILCKTAIGALKLNIGDLQVTKVRAPHLSCTFDLEICLKLLGQILFFLFDYLF